MLTTERTLGPGDVLRTGTKGVYRSLAAGSGEPHRRREELASSSSVTAPTTAAMTPIAVLAHLTDLHVMDPSSPTRLEVLAPLQRDERWRDLLGGAFRPQETLTAHAVADIAAVLGDLAGPATGRPAALAVVTGDNVDNCQANEVAAYVTALEGGRVRPGSGTGRYEGVQQPGWGSTWFWQPDADGDRAQTAWGFPHVPGFLDRVSRPFDAPGLSIPWLACYGNHDALLLGTTRANAAMRAIAVGARKASGPDPSFDPDDPLAVYLREPEALLRGPAFAVTPIEGRRIVDRDDFLAAHFGPRSRPRGHGFAAPSGLAQYSFGVEGSSALRIVVLDTTHPAGYWDGSIDAAQLAWLDDELTAADRDRVLVVLASHHATPSLVNTYIASDDEQSPPDGHPRLLAADLVAVLHRHPCVVAWLNGHHHQNRVVPHGRPGGGFWEITTAAIIDWPCQARLVELVDEGDGHLALVCTMVDLPAPVCPGDDIDAPDWCASIHRELAANQSWQHGGRLMGGVDDRNVTLALPHPYRH